MRLRRAILGLGAASVVCLAGAFFFIRGHGFDARAEPSRLEATVARRLRSFAIPPEMRDARNPAAATELAIAEGRDHFADHCAICHANDGSGRTQIGAHLYPPTPDMRTAATQDLSDGELFYMIRNGIPLTGMPGWGGEDEENWKLVLFIRHLPEILPVELELMNEINDLDTEVQGH